MSTGDAELRSARWEAGAAARRFTLRYLSPSLTLLALLVLWEAAVAVFKVPDYVLPAPGRILVEMIAQRTVLWGHTVVTTGEVLAGFSLSVAVGIPLSILIVYSPFFERTVYPLLVSSQTIPKVAIAPLFLFWFGFGLTSKIVVAFLIAFFPVVVSTVVGLRAIEPEMIYLARSMGASPLLTFIKVRLPHALPNIFGGLKVAITLAVVGAVVGEFVGADRGLGYVVVLANGALNTRLVFAAIAYLSLLGIVLFFLIELLERLLLPAHVAMRQEEALGTM
jgi:NitT/TauT family transport system permease protein